MSGELQGSRAEPPGCAPGQDLRRRAEAALATRAPLTPSRPMTKRGLWHELDVQQVELEMQNEELQRGRAELAASRDRYRALFDEAPVAYLTLDPGGVMLEVNAQAVALLGRPRDELVGAPLVRHVACAQAAGLADHLRVASASGERRRCDLTLIGPAGEPRRVQLTTIAAPDVAAPRLHVVVADATTRATSSPSLEVERAAGQREDDRRQLQHLEVLGHLWGQLAHEYRNIFATLKGALSAAELEAKRCASGRCASRPHVERLRAEIERASVMAVQVVALGRRSRPSLVPVEVDAAVAQMRPVLESLLASAGFGLELALEAPERWVLAGQGWLEQLLLGLTLNAREGLQPGARVRITTRLLPEGSRPAVALTIGHAAPHELVAPPPCSAGRRGHEPAPDVAALRELAQSMEGGIEQARSAGGGPSTFTVSLPCRRPRGRTQPVARPSSLQGRPRTVLVVDDEPLILRAIEHHLRQGGHRPVVAAGLEEVRTCLDQLQAPLDLVVIDVGQRDATARLLIDLVHQRHRRAAILHMSASPREQLVAEGRLAADAALIEKPFTAEELARGMSQVLGGPSL